MTNFSFRKSTEEDIAAVYRLMCELENETLPYDDFARIYRSQLDNENMTALVCTVENKAIAFLNLRFEEQLHHCGRIAEIMEFAVAPEYRSMGIGKAMLHEARMTALEYGCSQIEVSSNRMRSDAHRFYERERMERSHYKFSERLI